MSGRSRSSGSLSSTPSIFDQRGPDSRLPGGREKLTGLVHRGPLGFDRGCPISVAFRDTRTRVLQSRSKGDQSNDRPAMAAMASPVNDMPADERQLVWPVDDN